MNQAMALQIQELVQARKPFVLATVVEVIGSASAKLGSKALISDEGVNILGWVGGGCAEQEVLRQSQAALKSSKPFLIDVNMDDEVLGLGIRCGGSMRIFVEPVFPRWRWLGEEKEVVKKLAEILDFEVSSHGAKDDWSMVLPGSDEEIPGILSAWSGALAEFRKKSGESLKISSLNAISGPRRSLLVGDNRITQTLSRLLTLMGWTVDLVTKPSHDEKFSLDLGLKEYTEVILASQTHLDDQVLELALRNQVPYLGLIASQTRVNVSRTQFQSLWSEDFEKKFSSPCGIDLGARSPQEIALSVVSEILKLRGLSHV